MGVLVGRDTKVVIDLQSVKKVIKERSLAERRRKDDAKEAALLAASEEELQKSERKSRRGRSRVQQSEEA